MGTSMNTTIEALQRIEKHLGHLTDLISGDVALSIGMLSSNIEQQAELILSKIPNRPLEYDEIVDFKMYFFTITKNCDLSIIEMDPEKHEALEKLYKRIF